MRGQPPGGWWLGEERHDPARVALGELLMLLDPRDPHDPATWLVGERAATPAEVALIRGCEQSAWDAALGLLHLDCELSRSRVAHAYDVLARENER